MPFTLCEEHSEDGEIVKGITTHCEICGVRVWA
jgi:hypothetical protein